MVATLTRIFGLEHLTLAEDVVQATLARALQTWPCKGQLNRPLSSRFAHTLNPLPFLQQSEIEARQSPEEVVASTLGGLPMTFLKLPTPF